MNAFSLLLSVNNDAHLYLIPTSCVFTASEKNNFAVLRKKRAEFHGQMLSQRERDVRQSLALIRCLKGSRGSVKGPQLSTWEIWAINKLNK